MRQRRFRLCVYIDDKRKQKQGKQQSAKASCVIEQGLIHPELTAGAEMIPERYLDYLLKWLEDRMYRINRSVKKTTILLLL